MITPLIASNYVISYVSLADNESDKIFNISTISTGMLCADGMLIFVCPCMLLANCSMLPYWQITCAHVLCILYVHTDSHCVWMYALLYRMSVSLHFSFQNDTIPKKPPLGDSQNCHLQQNKLPPKWNPLGIMTGLSFSIL